MFFPRCGSTQDYGLRYRRSCGANLQALCQVLSGREPAHKFDAGKSDIVLLDKYREVLRTKAPKEPSNIPFLGPSNTDKRDREVFSVTGETTQHIEDSIDRK